VADERPVRAYATFRLLGELIDPDEIERRTGLKPEFAVTEGRTFPPSTFPWAGIWVYSSKEEIEESDLEEHLRHLLDRLEPVLDSVRELMDAQSLTADLWCFWDCATTESSGPQISIETSRRVAGLPIEEVVWSITDSSDED